MKNDIGYKITYLLMFWNSWNLFVQGMFSTKNSKLRTLRWKFIIQLGQRYKKFIKINNIYEEKWIEMLSLTF